MSVLDLFFSMLLLISMCYRGNLSVRASAMPPSGMETVVMVAIGVLAAVFVGALIALVMLCWQKLCQKGVCGRYSGKHCSHETRFV